MLLTPPSLLSESKEDSNDGFDYTDTLGHVEIDFELGNDEDEELMKFLQVGHISNQAMQHSHI